MLTHACPHNSSRVIALCAGGARGHRSRGFSLVDLLVSISIIVLLISIMMPGLGLVRRKAQQVICASNVRQLGLGVQMYADANRGHIPPSIYAIKPNPQSDPPADRMMTLRRDGLDEWDGLGWLYIRGFAGAPGVYYCPAHTGENLREYYSAPWAGTHGVIVGNYQYRGSLGGSALLERFRSSTALIADGLASQLDFNHRVGGNALRADISVQWFQDGGAVLATLVKDPGESGANTAVIRAWEVIDDHLRSPGDVPEGPYTPALGGPNAQRLR
jgi:type II secretory pathway pseudopilin PulG